METMTRTPCNLLCRRVLLVSTCAYLFFASAAVGQMVNPLLRSHMRRTNRPRLPLSLLSQQFLVAHNRVRALHGEPPLLWSGLLERYARDQARMFARTCTVTDSQPHGRFGVNGFLTIHPGMWPPARIVSSWASERRFFNPKSLKCLNPFQNACGHYTQVVWWTTQRIGCAQAPCFSNREMITVCAYDPAGNNRNQNPFAH